MFGKKFNKMELPEGYTVTYHAGFMGTEPNTTESLEKAIEMGAKIVEMDVTFRKDGTPVIIHADEAKDNEGVPFDDAMRAVAKSEGIMVNLDIKSVKNLPAVDETVKKYGMMDRVFYTGVWEKWVETVKTTSEIPYYLNYNVKKSDVKNPADVIALADKIISLGACGLNSNFAFANRRLVEVMHKKGIPVSLWTCNTKRTMKKALKTYPDNITSKEPKMLEDLIRYSK